MAAKTTTIKKDIIPYSAGVVILTPLNANGKPDRRRSVATGYDFLTSTQTSVSFNSESLANGNGQDKNYPLDATYTVTVITNVYNPVFHGVVTNRIETLPDTVLLPTEINHYLPETVPEGGSLSITFGEDGDYRAVPAADEDGDYNFVVEDSYGNVLTRLDTPENGAYAFDPDTKTLTFSEDYVGAKIRVIYNYADTKAIRYDSNPILSNPEYMIEIFGTSQSASGSDGAYKVVTILRRATASGDVTDQMTQKSKSAPITYTFTSAPVPPGVSVYSQILSPVADPNADTDTAVGEIKNIVNGCDDKFTVKP